MNNYKAKTDFTAHVLYQGGSLELCLLAVKANTLYADTVTVYRNGKAWAYCCPNQMDGSFSMDIKA
jgi:hypothetical protein